MGIAGRLFDAKVLGTLVNMLRLIGSRQDINLKDNEQRRWPLRGRKKKSPTAYRISCDMDTRTTINCIVTLSYRQIS